jgi:hypothetical protein
MADCAIITAMANIKDEDSGWVGVIGRSLAFLCLIEADLRDKDLATQGHFLESLGISRNDAAALLNTSYASLTELYRQAKSKKGARRGGKKKKA